MNEYVSIGAVIDIVFQYCPDDDGSCSKADVDPREMLDEIEALPVADVQPVRHGCWITQGDDMWLCSNCKKNIIYSMHESDRTENQRYCCRCGARMDGEKNE